MRKRDVFLNICLSVLLCVGLNTTKIHAEEIQEEPEGLYARSAVLMDADSGRILFEKEGEIVLPMASTTKIMTCILALECMEKEETVVVSEEAVRQPKVHLGVWEGETFYVEDLLYSMMLESHNDSAILVAEAIGGSVKNFAEQMNEKARTLGCEHTHFVTPNGLDAEDTDGIHGTTARELARIMKYCILESPMKEEFLKITQTKTYQFSDVEGKRQFSCTNHNAFLDMMDGALSGKTGFTADAGYCYVGALKKDKKTLIVALLACGWPNHKTYKWSDTKKLMTYGLENYEYKEVTEEVKNKAVVVKGAVDAENPYKMEKIVETKVQRKPISLLVKKGETIEARIEQTTKLQAPIASNTKVGEVIYTLNGEKIRVADILTTNAATKRTIHWCFTFLCEKILM